MKLYSRPGSAAERTAKKCRKDYNNQSELQWIRRQLDLIGLKSRKSYGYGYGCFFKAQNWIALHTIGFSPMSVAKTIDFNGLPLFMCLFRIRPDELHLGKSELARLAWFV